MAKRTKPSTDSDHPWKGIFSRFLEESILFIEPPLHASIDWSRGFEAMEQELDEIIKTRFRGAKLCDKLVKVWMKSGEPLFLLIHVEIETNPKAGFPLRFFHYRILIFDKHKSEDIYSIAVYPGNPSKNQVDKYEHKFLRNRILFEFPTLKIWEQDEENLKTSDNIFALLVLAQQYANKTKNDAGQRLRFREKLFELAIQKNIPERKIWEALIFVRQLATLPEKLEIRYNEYSRRKRKEKKQFMFTIEDAIWIDKQVEEDTGKSLRKQIIRAEEKARQAKLQLEIAVRRCYREEKLSVEKIANLFAIPQAEVERILKKKQPKIPGLS